MTNIYKCKHVGSILSGLILSLAVGHAQAAQPNRGAAPWVGDTFHNAPCRGNAQKFGPYDYLLRGEFSSELRIVEEYHFNSEKHDLDYTLRAWPNHHAALYEIILNQTRQKSSAHVRTPAECYAQRAVNFSPKDATARMLYALLLHRSEKPEQALKSYQIATGLDPANNQIKYNMALLLVDMKHYDEANKYAREVYAGGFPLPGLKSKLVKLGQWQGN